MLEDEDEWGDPYGDGDCGDLMRKKILKNSMYGSFGIRGIPTQDNAKLHDQPHYTEEYYKEARIIFGSKEDGLSWVYSDRLEEQAFQKARNAQEYARENCTASVGTARYYKMYLEEYFGRKLELPCIMAGANVSNGYPYQVFGLRFNNEKE